LHRLADHFVDAARFESMVRRFNSFGVLRNGLSDGENELLLTTTDPDTAVALVLRSVDRIASHRAG
jgi:hypothetical protein